jgi:uncharacterized repeat protein (TIGR01451 family)
MKSFHRTLRTFAVAALSLAAATTVHAQAQAPARASAQAGQPSLKVVAENRTAQAAAARGGSRADTTVHAGDVLRYRLTFTNGAPRAIRNVALANPVPGGLQFVAGSAKASRSDARAEYSLDGGKSWSARPVETVTVDGRQVERPVAPERYTAVRWVVDGAVAPAAVVTAEFEARLVMAPAKSAAKSPSTSTAPSAPGAR